MTKIRRITDDDVKSEEDLIDLGADKSKLISAAKIYVSYFGKTLLQAILDGDFNGGGGDMPFPSTLVTGTGAYTIPAGFNARVTVNCQNGEEFLINSVAILRSQNIDLERVSLAGSKAAPTTSVSVSNPVSPERYFIGAGRAVVNQPANVVGFVSVTNDGNTVSSLSTSGPSTGVDTGTVTDLIVGPGGTAVATSTSPSPTPVAPQRGPGSVFLTGVEIGKQNTNVSASYLLPPNTMIEGGSYVVELYPV